SILESAASPILQQPHHIVQGRTARIAHVPSRGAYSAIQSVFDGQVGEQAAAESAVEMIPRSGGELGLGAIRTFDTGRLARDRSSCVSDGMDHDAVDSQPGANALRRSLDAFGGFNGSLPDSQHFTDLFRFALIEPQNGLGFAVEALD